MRALLLDLDDTLLDDRGAVRKAFAAFISTHASKLPAQTGDQLILSWQQIAERHWRRHEAGELTFIEQRRCRVREFLNCAMSDEEADEAFRPYANVYMQSWRLFPEASAFLERTKHIPKVIITNGDRDQQLRKVQATGLADHVVAVVTPGDCGHWKPSERIFRVAMEVLGVDARSCLMIGDDLIRDIEPAIKLGMRHFHVEPGHPVRNLANALPRA